MISALQKTLKGSQYMQNILCFGVFVRDDASNNCCDSRLNITCYPAKRGQNHLNCPTSREIRGLQISYNKTSKMPNSDAEIVFGHDRFIIRHDNKGLAGRRLL